MNIYKIFLPSGKPMYLYFKGFDIERLLNSYSIPFAKGEKIEDIKNIKLTEAINI